MALNTLSAQEAGNISAPSANFEDIDISTADWQSTDGKTKSIYVGGGGDVAVQNDAGTKVVFYSAPTGIILPIRTDYVYDSAGGTTATNLVALLNE